MSGYEVLALVLGSLIAREVMALGIKAIAGGKPGLSEYRVTELDKELKEMQGDVRAIKRLLLQIAIKLKIDERDMRDLM